MSVRVTFHGAAKTVTGSRHLLEVHSEKVLIDCGLFQGKKELRLKNWEAPEFDPAELTAIVLTHAHVDHTGYLPYVVRHGFKGPIYCTQATADLLELLLLDTAHLQEEEASFANRHGTSKHHPAKPLFTTQDAKDTLKLLRVIPRSKPTAITSKITVEPRCAGHILGSTTLSVTCAGKRITFSGDIGRYDSPILPDPCPVEFGDLLVCESTYGDRLHETADVEAELAAAVKRALSRRGPILIPSFAVGRTQTLLYYLAKLERAGAIPVTPVFVDSPMAVDATQIYRRHKHDFDDEAQAILRAKETPLMTERTYFCSTVAESKALNALRGSRIILSASGMVNGGRILHHMKHHLPEENTAVLFVGYQAEGTRGRTIQSGAPEVTIFGAKVPIRAHIETISGLSAHGDKNELLRWITSSSGTPRLTRIVHGEEQSAIAFAQTLRSECNHKASAAEYLETVEL